MLTGLLLLAAGLPLAAADLGEGHELLRTYCYECHSHDQEEGGLNFQRFEDAGTLWDHRKTLDDSLFFVEEQEMPPADAGHELGDEDRARLIRVLQQRLAVLDGTAEPDDPGRVIMPRLTNTEYGNVIRDLAEAGIPAERFLPRDTQAGEGFTNVGAAQPVTAVHIERYLSAAKKVLEYARVSPLGGIVWDDEINEPVPTPGHRRKELVDGWVMALRQEEQELLGNTTRLLAMHLKGAWALRHGRITDAAAAAAAYSSERQQVIARSLELLLEYLESDELPAGIREQVLADWFALDRDSDEETAHAVSWSTAKLISGLGRIQEHWDVDETLKVETRLTGWQDHEDPETVYLVVNRGLGSPGRVAVTITDAAFKVDGGPDVSFAAAAPTPQTHSGERLHWNDGSLSLQAPAVVPIPVPAGAKNGVFRVRVADGTTGRAQVYLSWSEPDADDLVLRTGPIGRNWGNAPEIIGARDALQGFDTIQDGIKSLAEKREYNGAQPFYLENQHFIMFRGFDAVPHRYLEQRSWRGGELEPSGSRNQTIEERAATPFMLTGDHLVQALDADGRRRMERLREAIVLEAQVPHQQLLELCREQGLTDIVENQIPSAEQLRDFDAAAQRRARELIHAVEAVERDFAARAEELLIGFATRAWRRPPTSAEVRGLVALYTDRRGRGGSFDAAIKQAMRAVLVAPDFLYRTPRVAPVGDGIQPLDDHALADRLAFTLWGSIPDDALLARAEAGELSDPAVLRAEAERMLADEGRVARGLGAEFAGQWLGFAGFSDYTVPNPEQFPEFDAGLRARMEAEAIAFFGDLFANNRPLRNLVDADYAYVDRTLGEHYGINTRWNQKQIERTQLRNDERARRGGIFGMGAVLTKTSTALRTSPVLRGNWIVTIVLGRHIPEPPPVEPISEGETNEAGETITEQLMRHRDDPACFSCHAKIDPPGIALEHFDPIGRWRDHYSGGTDIEDQTELADGTTIAGLEGLRAYILAREDQLRRTFCTKLVGFALGRAVSITDEPLIDRMMAALEADDGRVQAALFELVSSPQFRRHRVAP